MSKFDNEKYNTYEDEDYEEDIQKRENKSSSSYTNLDTQMNAPDEDKNDANSNKVKTLLLSYNNMLWQSIASLNYFYVDYL